MKKIIISGTLIIIFALALVGVKLVSQRNSTASSGIAFADPAFAKTWEAVDKPVLEQAGAGRGYTWGPVVAGSEKITSETYNNGSRKVEYFEKARMEINNPAGDPNNLYYVTTGLLVKELVTGLRQDGDNIFVQLMPSTIQIAGDPNDGNANAVAPTYASFKNVVTFLGNENSKPDATGSAINATIDKNGTTGTGANLPENRLNGSYDGVTGHNIADVFVDYGKTTGKIWSGSAYLQGSVFYGDPTYVLGHPVTEPYWLRAVVGGVEKDVLVQLFERRVLTYTPSNPDGFKVEMGNVGQHYYRWRYSVTNSAAETQTATTAANTTVAATTVSTTRSATTTTNPAPNTTNSAVTTAPAAITTTAAATTTTIAPTSTTPAAGAPVYPLKVSANKRYLVDQNNQPFFMVGDSAWSLIAQLNKSDADTYLQNRQQYGFNTVLMNLIEHQFASNAPANIYGNAPFNGAAFTNFNEAYFAQADYVLNSAGQKGITVLLDPLYLGYNCGNEGWCGEVKNSTVAQMTAWGQYVGNRYKSYNNLIWLIGGDTSPVGNGVQDKVRAFVTGLQQADTRHILTAHNNPESQAISAWPGESWLTLNNVYSYNAAIYMDYSNAYNHSPALPYFLIETNYENEHSVTQQHLRAQNYWSALSGSTGGLFGNCPIWDFDSNTGWCDNGGTSWRTSINSAGSVGMSNFGKVFQGRNWQNLVPDWGHSFVSGGYGTWGGSDYATAALTADKTLGMVYIPTARTVTVNMGAFSSPVYGKWYDPVSGVYTAVPGGVLTNTGTKQFTTPGNNAGGAGDWVLIFETTP